MKTSLGFVVLLILACIASPEVHEASSATRSWTAFPSGDWSTATNWSGSALPSAGNEFLGNSPIYNTFHQTGGTNNISGALYLSYAMSGPAGYDLNGGVLTAASEFLGSSIDIPGIFNQGGGTNTLANA